MGRIVRKTMDEILQDRTASESRLRALADLPDEEIDFSDIPELTEEFWKNARPFREVMEERRARRTEKVTVAIDADDRLKPPRSRCHQLWRPPAEASVVLSFMSAAVIAVSPCY